MKKINLYGTGIHAIRYALINTNNIKVDTIIDGGMIKKFMPELFGNGVSVINVDEAENIMKKNYTIIASSENAYWEIKETLEKKYNLEEFEHFEYFATYQKKIAIMYGNCHAQAIKGYLEQNPVFYQEYGFYPMKPICEMQAQSHLIKCVAALERCDLFLHQCIWEKNVYGPEFASERIICRLPNKCQILGLPNVYRMPRFLFPAIDFDADHHVYEGRNFFPFRDKYIDSSHNKLTESELADMVCDESLIPISNILLAKEEFYEKVKKREKQWDVKISSYLINMIEQGNKKIFFDQNHPTPVLIEYIAEEVLKLIGKAGSNKYGVTSPMDTYELPIYASVKKALHITYDIDYIRCFNGLKLRPIQMNLEEYIRQYIAWNFPQTY